MACAWHDPSCRIGVIVGTGTNACYVENVKNIGMWDEDYEDHQQMIVNTEWPAFGDNGSIDFIRTEYDRIIDENSLNPGRQVWVESTDWYQFSTR